MYNQKGKKNTAAVFPPPPFDRQLELLDMVESDKGTPSLGDSSDGHSPAHPAPLADAKRPGRHVEHGKRVIPRTSAALGVALWPRVLVPAPLLLEQWKKRADMVRRVRALAHNQLHAQHMGRLDRSGKGAVEALGGKRRRRLVQADGVQECQDGPPGRRGCWWWLLCRIVCTLHGRAQLGQMG